MSRARFSNDFCLWLVPPHEGRVRRYRFSTARLAALLLGSFGFVVVVGFMTGDYLRIQIDRAKNFGWLERLTREKNYLEEENTVLQSRMSELRDTNTRMGDAHQDIRSRLKELNAVVKSAAALGVVRSGRPKSGPKSDGIGGAETDCAGPKSACGDEAAIGKRPISLRLPMHDNFDKLSDAQIAALLDDYIRAVRALPLSLPGSAPITSGYGYRLSPFHEGSVRRHEGVDLSLPYGSPVYSTGDGLVQSVKWHPTYGLVVDVEHTDGITSRYAHLSKALVKEGQRVKRGAALGKVGTSGRSTGPHLHYEIRVDGRAQNPMRFVAFARRLSGMFS